MDIEKKIKSIEENCIETAEKDAKDLEEKIEMLTLDKVNQRIEEYKKELEIKFEKELGKIQRDYNKNIFDYEQNQKMKTNDFKKTLLKNIQEKVENELKNFTNSEEYKKYLFHSIETSLSKIRNKSEETKLSIVENDYLKYKDEIIAKFNVKVEKIDNKFIGGCKLLDLYEKISIDNTIRNNINENIK